MNAKKEMVMSRAGQMAGEASGTHNLGENADEGESDERRSRDGKGGV
jgi:hypothetical protein